MALPHAVSACGKRMVLALPSARMSLKRRIGSLIKSFTKAFACERPGLLPEPTGKQLPWRCQCYAHERTQARR